METLRRLAALWRRNVVTAGAGGTATSTLPYSLRRPGAASTLPHPALRWIGPQGRIALRAFDFQGDADAVCAFQEETYTLNFPDFIYNESFAAAFRHDLRRAALDPHHGVFVLDERPSSSTMDGAGDGVADGAIIGFLWLVVCQNTWTGERYGYINNLYIIPARRGQGLADELMRHADTFFRQRHVGRVRLTVTAANAAAVRLYERSGYGVARWEMEKEL